MIDLTELVHFHGGPLRGQTHHWPLPLGAKIFATYELDPDGADSWNGYYTQDHTSAGGRCYDWSPNR